MQDQALVRVRGIKAWLSLKGRLLFAEVPFFIGQTQPEPMFLFTRSSFSPDNEYTKVWGKISASFCHSFVWVLSELYTYV
jgi:hypothetical protein